jgi:hypothetical protein
MYHSIVRGLPLRGYTQANRSTAVPLATGGA